MSLPPQAPFPEMPMVFLDDMYNKKRRITRAYLTQIIDIMLSPKIHDIAGNIEQFIQHIEYNQGLRTQFRDYYRNILNHLLMIKLVSKNHLLN